MQTHCDGGRASKHKLSPSRRMSGEERAAKQPRLDPMAANVIIQFESVDGEQAGTPPSTIDAHPRAEGQARHAMLRMEAYVC